MDDILYLDTARLGQVAPSASLAIKCALELNEACGAAMYLDDLLESGFYSLPHGIAQDFSGLSSWRGIEQLKRDIADFVYPESGASTVLASRTASLVQVAAEILFSRCRNVMTTDLTWPNYQRILEQSPTNKACGLTVVEIKTKLLSGELDSKGLSDLISDAYLKHGCDGIFLPSICNFGIRLPVRKLMRQITSKSQVRFSVVDAAQSVNHIDLQGLEEVVDFTIAGSHKWIRSYAPLAFGLYAKQGSSSFIKTAVSRHLASDIAPDPLLKLTENADKHVGETLNLTGLFACSGAVQDVKTKSRTTNQDESRHAILGFARNAGWETLEPKPEFQSRIVMLRKPKSRNLPVGKLRRLFLRKRIAISDYAGGLCRLSIPDALDGNAYREIQAALNSI